MMETFHPKEYDNSRPAPVMETTAYVSPFQKRPPIADKSHRFWNDFSKAYICANCSERPLPAYHDLGQHRLNTSQAPSDHPTL
jgi:hypothetical protein